MVAALALSLVEHWSVAYEEAQTRSGIVQSGLARRRSICGRPQGGRVRVDRLGERQGAIRLSLARARQGHCADAGRPGRREDDSASARDLVCASIAWRTSAVSKNTSRRYRPA